MAKFHGLGRTRVTVPGTPQRIVIPTTVAPPTCHAFNIEALFDNTGKIFIGTTGMNKTTLANVLAVLPIPTANMIPTFTSALAQGSNAIPLDDLWVDSDVANEGILLSVLIG